MTPPRIELGVFSLKGRRFSHLIYGAFILFNALSSVCKRRSNHNQSCASRRRTIISTTTLIWIYSTERHRDTFNAIMLHRNCKILIHHLNGTNKIVVVVDLVDPITISLAHEQIVSDNRRRNRRRIDCLRGRRRHSICRIESQRIVEVFTEVSRTLINGTVNNLTGHIKSRHRNKHIVLYPVQ